MVATGNIRGRGEVIHLFFFVVAQMGYDRCTNVAFVSCGKHHKHHLLRGTRAFTFFYFVKVGK